MERSKRPALLVLARLLAEADVPYAIIGGVALQVHLPEPRTTLDVDLALPSLELVPRDRLTAAGFHLTGRFAHSENWIGPEDVPVQFTDDPALRDAVLRAEVVALEDVSIRVIRRADLLHAKFRAAADPARRRSKRLQDLADAQALIEATPELTTALTPAERALLDRAPR
jgi:hypothetical protein